ncbi:MAG TPA: glycine/sarcosine/betaine reductase selenoprotein B family protein, partial [Blastocatellia bacterium]|nr:glycine/sarcosine/betaine reductase selenoprotein B family protein [Blastocatellia bacterium]
DLKTLIEDHRSPSFDHSGVQADANLAFPIDRFRELQARGAIGELNHRHFSFMGSILNPRKLIEKTSVKVAELLFSDGVDVAFLTPV